MRKEDLINAVGGISDDLIREADGSRRPSGNRKKWIALAVAAVILLSAVMIVPAVLSRERPSDISGNASEEVPLPSNTVYDEFGADIMAPWKDGSLKFTSVSYRHSSAEPLPALKLPSARLLSASASSEDAPDPSNAVAPSESDISPADSMDTGREPAAEEVTVSMADNIRIEAAAGTRFIRIKTEEKGHANCDGVYYDVQEDKTICISCMIRDRMKGNPYYTDACVRALIEECVIGPEELAAGMVDGVYHDAYLAIYESEGLSDFGNGKSPSASALGIKDIISPSARQRMAKYKFPAVSIVEYGSRPDKCVFTLVSAGGQAVYGSFVYDFIEESFTKIDGETLGVPRCLNGFFSWVGDEMTSVQLPLASGVAVDANYTELVATIPYYASFMEEDQETGLFSPVYEASNIFVFDLTSGTCSAVFGLSREMKDDLRYPTGPAIRQNGVICFPAGGHLNGYAFPGGLCYIEGEFLAVLTDGVRADEAGESGGRIAAVKQDGNVRFFRLRDGAPAETDVDAFSASRWVKDGNEAFHLPDLKREKLFEKTPDAIASSADGRFLYACFKDDGRVECVDLATLERADLEPGDAFLSQTSGQDDVNVAMYVSGDGTHLLLSYFRTRALRFRKQDFLKAEYERYGSNSDDFLKSGLSLASQYYELDDGTKVSFAVRDSENRLTAACILCADDMIRLGKLNFLIPLDSRPDDYPTWQMILADTAEKLCEYAEVSGNVAYIRADAMKALLNGADPYAVRKLFSDLNTSNYRWFDAGNEFRNLSGEPVTPAEARSAVADETARVLMLYFFGYTVPEDEFLEESRKNGDQFNVLCLERYYREVNEGLDEDEMRRLLGKLKSEVLKCYPEESPVKPSKNTVYAYNHSQMFEEISRRVPDIFEDVTGTSYLQALSEGKLGNRKYNRNDFFASFPLGNGSMNLSPHLQVNKEALDEAVADARFRKGTVAVNTECAVYLSFRIILSHWVPTEKFTYLSFGRDENGNCFAVAEGGYAELTEEQYQSVLSLLRASRGYDPVAEGSAEWLRESIVREIAEEFE